MLVPINSSSAVLVVYPPYQGFPGGGTVRVHTPAISLGSAAAATQDAVLAQTNADAAQGSDGLPFLEGPAVVKGRKYLVDIVDGQTFPVEVIGAGDTTRLAQPLPMDVPAGSTLRGWALTYTLSAEQTALSGPGYAIWDIVDAEGVVVPTFTTTFEVANHASGFALTWTELTRRMPNLQHEKPTHDDTGEETIAAAWMQHVLPALSSRGMKPHFIVDQNPLKVVHAAAVAYTLFPQDEQVKAEFYEKLQQVLAGRELWYDSDEGETQELSTADKGNGAQFVGVRLVR